MTIRRLFNYPGSKRKFSVKIEGILSGLIRERPSIWIEPFCGSTSLFYNIGEDVTQYSLFDEIHIRKAHLNDLDPNVMLMHRACRDFNYQDYREAVDFADSFGNVGDNPAAYYSYRKWYNETGSKMKEAGLHLIFLTMLCINSMLRFGPNGMNASFGRRRGVISRMDWEKMHRRLKNAVLTSMDYRELYIMDGAVIFLDPPYEKKDNGLYGKGFSQDEFLDWLTRMKKSHPHCSWLYTDVESPKTDKLLEEGFTKTILRAMPSIAPGHAGDEKSAMEAIYICKGEN